MNTRIIAVMIGLASATAFAQQPAAPAAPARGGARGGGARGATGPTLNAAQQAAVGAMKVAPDLQAAATAAAAALTTATFATPMNAADIAAKAQALGNAELNLATARAEEFQKAQMLLTKIGPELSAAVIAAATRGGAAPANTNYSDYAGFTKLWDGSTFTNWDGETNVWSIVNGAIHADTTITTGQHHLHYVGPGAVMKDFDFRVEVKMSAIGANGGIQYRSRRLNAIYRQDNEAPLNGNSRDWKAAEADPLGKRFDAKITDMAGATAAGLNASGNLWQISGYQFDMSSDGRYPGQWYEGQGRGIVSAPGGFVMLFPNRQTVRIATIQENPQQFTHPHMGLDGEWNQFEIIAKGNTIVHLINGHVITVGIDADPSMAALQGMLSLQLEGSGQIWYRNVYVKPLN